MPNQETTKLLHLIFGPQAYCEECKAMREYYFNQYQIVCGTCRTALLSFGDEK